MLRRKLEALKYPPLDSFNIDDEVKVRLLIAWFEKEHIRRYDFDQNVDEYGQLQNVKSPNWDNVFQKYISDLGGIPEQIKNTDRTEVVNWLLSLAMSYKYKDKRDSYPEIYTTKVENRHQAPVIKTANPLDNLDFGSPDFNKGIEDVAKLLGITCHPDYLVTLEAIAKLVHTKMSTNCVKDSPAIKSQGAPWPIKEAEADMGFKAGDYVSNQASRILRLLYIHDLRELQTKINECIVAVQKISANPKTDARLGKIGS